MLKATVAHIGNFVPSFLSKKKNFVPSANFPSIYLLVILPINTKYKNILIFEVVYSFKSNILSLTKFI